MYRDPQHYSALIRFPTLWGLLYCYFVAEFISPPKVYTFSFRVGSIIPESVKCIHSATKNPETLAPNPAPSAAGTLRAAVVA